jgi:DNA invertase Pin-like site-specific DNA recombinase
LLRRYFNEGHHERQADDRLRQGIDRRPDLTNQRAELHAAGCTRIFAEKITGTHAKRPELARMLDHLRAGDVVTVTRLDRLARSTRDLLDIAEQLQAKGAGLRSLAEPWADTTTPAGRMVLTVFAGIAEFERSLIIDRTRNGREAAKREACSSAAALPSPRPGRSCPRAAGRWPHGG